MNAQEIYDKRIEEAAKEIAQKTIHEAAYDEWWYDHCEETIKHKLIEMANYALSHQWISVEEALPTLDEKYDFSERYIVRTQNNEIKVMRIFRNIAWCDIYRGGAYIPFEKDIVTHWMPIPSLEGGE